MSARIATLAVAMLCCIAVARADDAGVSGAPVRGDAGVVRVDAGALLRVDAGVPVRVDAGVPVRDAGVPLGVDAGAAGGRGAPVDAGSRDAGVVFDTTTAEVVDAGVPDARRRRVRDAGVPGDAGVPDDAGILDDAGLDDAGLDDAGLPDAGVYEDAGVPDAGVPDAGLVSPIAGEPPPQPVQPPTAESTKETTVFAVQVIGGLLVLLVLAYLGGHRRVVRFQERLGLGGLVTAGFPFIALGVIAALPSVGILTGQVLDSVRPLLHFGLGWLGFIIGAQLDIRVLERVPRGTAYMILVEAIAPFAATATACGALMFAFGADPQEPMVWRDIVLLGAAAAMTSPRKFRGFANRTWHEGRGADVLLGQLDELVGVIGLLFLTAYFRPHGGSAWQLPSTAWVFVSLGIGVAIGAVIFAMVRMPTSNAEFLAVLLGSIAFASGFAGYLRLSPIVICFVAGVLVTNFPNEERDNVFRILRHLERPVHLLFLVIAGALWTVSDWRGWLLVPVFVAARVAGKWLGTFASKTVLGDSMPAAFLEGRKLVPPLSALSIALVVSVEGFSSSPSLAWVVTAVIGGAIASELLAQRLAGRTEPPAAAAAPPPPPVDELDAGPVYRDDEEAPR